MGGDHLPPTRAAPGSAGYKGKRWRRGK